jgi:hypothetical protein
LSDYLQPTSTFYWFRMGNSSYCLCDAGYLNRTASRDEDALKTASSPQNVRINCLERAALRLLNICGICWPPGTASILKITSGGLLLKRQVHSPHLRRNLCNRKCHHEHQQCLLPSSNPECRLHIWANTFKLLCRQDRTTRHVYSYFCRLLGSDVCWDYHKEHCGIGGIPCVVWCHFWAILYITRPLCYLFVASSWSIWGAHGDGVLD